MRPPMRPAEGRAALAAPLTCPPQPATTGLQPLVQLGHAGERVRKPPWKTTRIKPQSVTTMSAAITTLMLTLLGLTLASSAETRGHVGGLAVEPAALSLGSRIGDWGGAGLDGAGLDGAGLDGAGLDGAGLDGAGWDGAEWDGAEWDGAGWGGAGWGGRIPANESLVADQDLTDRDKRILFTLVRFKNSGCTVGSNSGTCYTASECRRIGGTNIGSCARGFGVCCYKEITCGGSSSTNCTYLVSPNYPNTYNEAQTCTMTFTRNANTCQLRLDFEEFMSTQPDNFGVCQEDQFTVPGERKFAYLCGNKPSEPWHFYLDVNGKPNPTVFNFLTTATSFNRKFKIKVSMIECREKVPCGCGQYFTGMTGTIQSFNYGSGPYLAELDYGICTRKEKNKCTTTLTTLGPSFTACPFDLYRIPVGQTGASNPVAAFNVQALYCQLFAANNPLNFQDLTTIPSPLTSVSNGPFMIWHMTNNDLVPNALIGAPELAGFYQSFTHNPC
ncbi:uncharacterized protein LOC125046483 [Penaeus chinensis]|uniref:uncharacterized protein LOC125046483 n=1 Tax=Penaeus chinensis TaxID=139456 RepID=UPI001FB81423|nr:uncharacterized protein LOC125046483 [Penaeus chinensis]